MEGDAGSNIHSSNYSKFSNPLYGKAPVTSTKINKSSSSNPCVGRDGQNHKADVANESVGTCTSQSQLCVPDVFDSKRRRISQTYFQSKKSEQICSHEQISAHKRTQNTRFSATSRLACQNRLVKCLLSPASIEHPQVSLKSDL